MRSHLSVQRWATALKVLTLVALSLLLAALGFGILFSAIPPEILNPAGVAADTPISGTRRAEVAAIGVIPALAMAYVLVQMMQLFALYEVGDFLTRDTAQRIFRAGLGLIATMVLKIIAAPLQVLVTSLANPPGSRVLAIGFEGADLGLLLSGGLLMTIAWTVSEAARLADENRAFV